MDCKGVLSAISLYAPLHFKQGLGDVLTVTLMKLETEPFAVTSLLATRFVTML